MISTPGFSRIAVVASLLLVPLCRAADGTEGWDLLKSLAGDWDASTSEGKRVRVSYQIVSNGSAVLETIKAHEGQADMITVYHRDGGALMLTHYCAVGNQPRMRVASAHGKRIAFRFMDATNLSSPGAGHMRDLTITVADANHFTQEWIYRAQGKDSRTIFRLTRLAPSEAK